MAKRHLSTRSAASQLDVATELANLEKKSSGELAEDYAELFKETCRSRNKAWLIRRILWRMQPTPLVICPNAPASGRRNWPTMPKSAPRRQSILGSVNLLNPMAAIRDRRYLAHY